MTEVTISKDDFKALSSDTRTKIIKLLMERNHTLSELSKKLNLKAPTIKQHLEILESTGLIEQIDSMRKWKYYSLTGKGKKIFSETDSTHILIVISLAAVALMSVIYLFFTNVFYDFSQKLKTGETLTEAMGVVEKKHVVDTGMHAIQIAPNFQEFVIYLTAVIFLAALVGFLIAKYKSLRF